MAGGYRDGGGDAPTVELRPAPTSKNSGNRFVAVAWDRELVRPAGDGGGDDPLRRHADRVALTEEHVMHCRKTSLYNETFNADSAVDVLWSLPM
jgi:hypothetical protein